MKTYQQASDYLGSKQDRPLSGRSTRLLRLNDSTIAVRYHSTNVVTYHKNGFVTVNSDGYRTVTTKARINEYTTLRVWSAKGNWQVSVNGATYPFADNLTLTSKGKIRGIASAASVRRDDKRRKAVRTYAKAYMTTLFAGKLNAPSAGDCWFCAYHISDDSAHILEHFREKYFVPSLLNRAIAEFPVSHAALYTLSALWGNGDDRTIGAWGDIAKRQLSQSLVKYLDRQLGL